MKSIISQNAYGNQRDVLIKYMSALPYKISLEAEWTKFGDRGD